MSIQNVDSAPDYIMKFIHSNMEQLCKIYYGEEMHTYYKKFKKKDDLADCLLQCLDYIKKQKLLNEDFIERVFVPP